MSDTARSVLDEDDLFAGGDVVPMRLGDAVIQRITQAIHDGRLKPGDFLPSEARIAASFGVSKPIAREAIRQLAAMGVVHIQQGKPTRVQALDAAPLDRFYRFAVRGRANGLTEAVELRRILEPPIAAHSAERRTAEDIEKLDLILARMEDALGNVPRWIEADLDFHEAVAASSGNRLLDFQIRGLRPVIREVMEIFNSREARGPADWQRTFDRHVRVVDAIRAGDPAAAFAAMNKHFEAAEAAIAELANHREDHHEPEGDARP
ncbi:FadR family transcriptional regulator [Bosea sp. SSUT16]|jgi:GntR family transcriptional repressor for pyruvate dehydrogenase complex|uniref:FadR family transcriptional regulator n=1 Tax=Bosea spartocytisi TaxID=2773451 RepID=A0A927HYK4_9HYPH|nr:FadR/GntR family transcriptional regulator [Bosea spartocytisi]MBD3844437.1 FadR family transcriptional regulator [Bosea spartocytisi]MCT4470457.1 FadR family transcriptional regulator [Bosea spartocytisi]